MSASGYTPIQLYYSTTAAQQPLAANLSSGELAVNITDGKLYYKDNSGTVQLLATKTTASGNLPGGTTGAIAYQSSASNTTFLSIGTNGYILTSSGTLPQYTNPSSITVGLATSATTATNLASGAIGSVPYQSGSGATTFLALGTTNYVLTAGASAPQYVAQSTLSVGTATTAGSATTATTATNLAGGSANRVAYQSGASTTAFVPAPTISGYVLGWNGTDLTWVNAPAATSAANLGGGGAYTVVYQSSTGTTAYLTNGTTGQVLTANTSGAPTWGSAVGNATNLTGGGAYTVVYQSATGTTAYLTNGTTGQILTANTGGAPTWGNASTTSTNLAGGSAGVVPYQSATGTTSFTAVGTSGYYLQSNGTGAPTWTAINALPSQSGQGGKYLYTDGSNASWQNTGASAGGVIWENSTNISSNYTLTTSKNGLSVGPITIASGVAVTVPTGQRWVIL